MSITDDTETLRKDYSITFCRYSKDYFTRNKFATSKAKLLTIGQQRQQQHKVFHILIK